MAALLGLFIHSLNVPQSTATQQTVNVAKFLTGISSISVSGCSEGKLCYPVLQIAVRYVGSMYLKCHCGGKGGVVLLSDRSTERLTKTGQDA